jgi:hypothetical protein
MSKLRFEQITKDEDLITYRENFYKRLKGGISGKTKQMSLHYLQHSKVVAIFNEENEMVAGYMLGERLPLRLLDFVPVDEREVLETPDEFSFEECVEIVCCWKSPGVPKMFMATQYWPRIFDDALASKKKYLLGHNQSKKLDKMYTIIGPTSLYTGESTYGLPSHLFYFTKNKIRLFKAFALYVYRPARITSETIKKWKNNLLGSPIDSSKSLTRKEKHL